MMKRTWSTLGAAAALSLGLMAGTALAQDAKTEKAKISLVLVNDIDQMSDAKGRGGYAKYAAVVAAERAKNPNTLAIHAGDTISPCLLCGLDQGVHMIDILNTVKPDIFVPGNHEFDFGKKQFLDRMAEAKFPVLAANIRMPDGSQVPNTADTKMVEMAGLKIGFVGAVTEDTIQIASPEDIKFQPAKDVTIAKAKELKAAGADLTVAVVHTPVDVDFALMQARAADVILTGHDHDLRVVYDGRTAMVESSSQGTYVTVVRLDVTIVTDKDNKRTVTWRPDFETVDSATVTADPVVLAKIKEYEAVLDKELNVEIGKTATALDSRRASVRGMETAIGNLFADALRASTGADVAIMNGGGIRANKEYPAGATLTRRDILSELPFGNSSVMVELSGADLKAALENGFSQVTEGGGRFPQLSGAKVVVDKAAPAGSRIVSLEVGGAPLDPAKKYKVAANEFLLAGGDGYTALGKGKVLIGKVDGKLLANEVMSYIRQACTVSPTVEGRIVYK